MNEFVNASKFRIIHYNDVYNIDEGKSEPLGGAARFVTAVKKQIETSEDAVCFVTFAGDVFSPSPLTPFTEGAEMPPIMNMVNTTVACVGNHEMDNGLDVMRKRISETNFPWILSNMYEKTTGIPIGGVQRCIVMEKARVKIGFFGIASEDWIKSLTCIRHEEYVFIDPVECTNSLSKELREMGCDVIICLSHMSLSEDYRVASEAIDIDIILSGHDHIVLTKKMQNGRWIVKAGSDFKNLASIDFTVSKDKKTVTFEEPSIIYITRDVEKNVDAEKFVQNAMKPLNDPALNKKLVLVETTLDGRFFSIRTQETGLGNLVCDALAFQTKVPNAFYNSGAYRSDNIDPPSPWTQREMQAVLPFKNNITVIRLSGDKLLRVLEDSVSKYPELSGYFLQVSGIKFSFDPSKPPGSRVNRRSATATSDSGEIIPIGTNGANFTIVTNKYMFEQYCSAKITFESDFVRDEALIGPEIVSAYMKNIETDKDMDGINELGVISPKIEGRIVCTEPDPELSKKYPFPKN